MHQSFPMLKCFCVCLLGNNHMKEENYSSAVDCYTKAIELDQRNAVYYCNRWTFWYRTENASLIKADVLMFGVDWWDCSLSGLRHIVNLETTQRQRETVNERLPSTLHTAKLMAEWGEMVSLLWYNPQCCYCNWN